WSSSVTVGPPGVFSTRTTAPQKPVSTSSTTRSRTASTSVETGRRRAWVRSPEYCLLRMSGSGTCARLRELAGQLGVAALDRIGEVGCVLDRPGPGFGSALDGD